MTKFRDGVAKIERVKTNNQARTWTGSIAFNAAMVAVGVGCGVGAVLVKDRETR